MIIRMRRKNNLIQIQIVNNNNHPALTAQGHLGQGNTYALELWQIKKRAEHDKLCRLFHHKQNTIRKLRIWKRMEQGKKGGVKVHQAILAIKRSVNINNLIQIEAKAMNSHDEELWKNLRLTVTNLQSIKNKDTNLLDHLVDNRTDICIAMDTWLNDNGKTCLECDLSKNGFQIQLVNRKDKRGGGLALISTTNIKIKKNGEKISFEYALWKGSTTNSSVTLLAIYHPHHRLTIQCILCF